MNMISQVFLVFAVFILSGYGVEGIRQDQLGEYDWKRENIGRVEKTLIHSDTLISATEDSILAGINLVDGSIKWRTALPANAIVKKMISVRQEIMVLSIESSTLDTSTMVRSFNVLDGQLLWDISLGKSFVTQSDALDISDIVYDVKLNIVTVLSDNALHFITKPHLNTAITLWSWSAQMLQLETVGISSKQKFVLSGLVVPSASEAGEGPLELRIAVGCLLKPDSTVAVCENAILLKARHSTQSIALEVIPVPMPTSPSGLRAAVDSDAANTYMPDDVLFGVTVAPEGSTVKSLSVLSLRSKERYELEPSASAALTGDLELNSLIMKNGDGSYSPALSICSNSVLSSVITPSSCSLFVAEVGSLGDLGSESIWYLRPVTPFDSEKQLHCESTRNEASMAYSLSLRYDVLSFYEGVATSAFCVSLDWEGASEEDGDSSSLGTLAISNIITGSKVAAKLDLKDPSFSLSPSRSLHHFSVHRMRSPGSKTNDLGDYMVLLVLNSGVTVLLRVAEDNMKSPKLLWVRHEGLASVRQALVADSPASSLQDPTEREVEALDELPNFAQRLNMQKQELLLKSMNFFKFLQEFPDYIKRTIHGDGSTRRDLSKMKLFGFDKIAICLCYSERLDSALKQGSGGQKFSEARIQVVALQLLQDRPKGDQLDSSVLWTTLPVLRANSDVSMKDPVVTFVKIFRTPPVTSGDVSSPVVHPSRSVTLVLGTEDGQTLMWFLDLTTGKVVRDVSASCENALGDGGVLSGWNARQSVVSDSVLIKGHGAPKIAALTTVARTVGSSQSVLEASLRSIIIVHESQEGSEQVTVSRLGSSALGNDPEYVHTVDKTTGVFSIYQLRPGALCEMVKTSNTSAVAIRNLIDGFKYQIATRTAAVNFDPETEIIVDVAYPGGSGARRDPVHSRASVLGDDSVLVKYLNPNMVLVATLSPPSAASAPPFSNPDLSQDPRGENATSLLTLTMVDAVSGRVIRRVSHEDAALPVQTLLLENHIVATFWNSKGKRTELSSIALFDGAIDKYELSPLSSSSSRRAPGSSGERSVFSAQVTPMVVQKSYALSRAVTALQHTRSEHGIARKHILIALRNGQVFSVDLRQIHPRRPSSDPTPAEKEEGLTRYYPHLTLQPISAITLNETLIGGGARILLSASAHLESSSLVLCVGGGRKGATDGSVDIFLNRVLPSQGFDLLATDFNHLLLVLILLTLAAAVLVLRRMQQTKLLKSLWS